MAKVLTDNVVTNLQAQIDIRVKYTDKATDAEAAAGTADNKWVTPKQINPLSTLRVGDILCSGRKVEEETNGKWALCDGRVYAGNAYPELLQKVGMRYGAVYQYQKYISLGNSYGTSTEYIGFYGKPELLCRSDGSSFLYLPYKTNSSTQSNSLFYIPANYNIGYLSSVLTYAGTAQDYYAVYMFDDFVYYVDGVSKVIKIIDTSNKVTVITPTGITSNWYPLCAFKYNNYIYFVVTISNQSNTNAMGITYYYIRIAVDSSVYTKAMGTLTSEAGLWAHAVFNYTDHLIYLSASNYAYNITSEKFVSVTKPQILTDFAKISTKKIGIYTNNGTLLHILSGVYDLTSFSKQSANSLVNNEYFSFKNDGEYFYAWMTNKQYLYQVLPSNGSKKVIPRQDIFTQIPQDAQNNKFNGSPKNYNYIYPKISAAMNPETIKFIPYCGFGTEYNSSTSKYTMSINVAIYEIQKSKIRLPNYVSYLSYTLSGGSIDTEVDNRYIKLL